MSITLTKKDREVAQRHHDEVVERYEGIKRSLEECPAPRANETVEIGHQRKALEEAFASAEREFFALEPVDDLALRMVMHRQDEIRMTARREFVNKRTAEAQEALIAARASFRELVDKPELTLEDVFERYSALLVAEADLVDPREMQQSSMGWKGSRFGETLEATHFARMGFSQVVDEILTARTELSKRESSRTFRKELMAAEHSAVEGAK